MLKMRNSPEEASPPIAIRRRRRFVLPAILILTIIALPLIWLGLEVAKRRTRWALVEEIEASGGMITHGNLDFSDDDWVAIWENALEYIATGQKPAGDVESVHWILFSQDAKLLPLAKNVVGNFPTIQELFIDGAEVDCELVSSIARLRRLKSLSISRTNITDDDLAYFSAHPNLHNLDLDQTDISNAGLDRLGKPPELRLLSLHGTRVSLEAVEKLRNTYSTLSVDWTMPLSEEAALASRQLYGRGWIVTLHKAPEGSKPLVYVSPNYLDLPKPTDGDRLLLGSLPTFDLHLSMKKATVELLDFVLTLEQLEGLLITDVGDAEMRKIALVSQLKRLRIQPSALTDDGLASLSENMNLEWFTVLSGTITNQAIEHIGKLPQLKHLYLPSCKVADNALESLIHLSQLETLSLTGASLSEAELKNLASLKNLKKLELPRATFDDRLVQLLLSFPALEELDLGGTPVSNSGLKRLAEMPRIKAIHCYSGEEVAEAAIQEFRAIRPDVKINGK